MGWVAVLVTLLCVSFCRGWSGGNEFRVFCMKVGGGGVILFFVGEGGGGGSRIVTIGHRTNRDACHSRISMDRPPPPPHTPRQNTCPLVNRSYL